MKFINTFRGRLLLILSLLLIATLGVQYYLNLLTQRENNDLREAQAQALVAGITLGFKSMLLKDKRVGELIEEEDQPYFDAVTKERIKDIIIIDNNWVIDDSLNPDYLPTTDDNDEVVYRNLADITDLPPLMEGGRLGEDLKFFPNASVTDKSQTDEAHAIPIETSRGRWYVMVLLRNDRNQAAWRAAQPLVFTLGLLTV